jgi:hypothetical protein
MFPDLLNGEHLTETFLWTIDGRGEGLDSLKREEEAFPQRISLAATACFLDRR